MPFLRLKKDLSLHKIPAVLVPTCGTKTNHLETILASLIFLALLEA